MVGKRPRCQVAGHSPQIVASHLGVGLGMEGAWRGALRLPIPCGSLRLVRRGEKGTRPAGLPEGRSLLCDGVTSLPPSRSFSNTHSHYIACSLSCPRSQRWFSFPRKGGLARGEQAPGAQVFFESLGTEDRSASRGGTLLSQRLEWSRWLQQKWWRGSHHPRSMC